MPTQHPLGLLVRSLELQTPLSGDTRDAVLDLPHTIQTLDPSTYIQREGEQPTRCGVLVSGFAYRQKITGAGARQIIAIQMPGDTVDFQNLFFDISDHSVQLLTRSEVAFVPQDAMQTLVCNNAEVAQAVFLKTLIEASILRERVVNMGRRNARERIAHLLCEFGFRLEALGLQKQSGYELPMTQEQLGDAVGLTSVHVNRTLKGLKAEGLIVSRVRICNLR